MNCFVYILYAHASIKYIGVSIDPLQRFKNHFYAAFHKEGKEYNLKKSRWIRAHKNDIKYKVIFTGSEHECYIKEIELIALAKAKGIDLVNLTDGGDRAPKISEHNNPELTKQKISAKALGREISIETRQKMSIAHKANIPKHLKNHHKGKSNPRSYSVMALYPSGEPYKVYAYAKLAIEELGLNKTAITDCLMGRQKTAGGFRWTNCSNHGFPKVDDKKFFLNAG